MNKKKKLVVVLGAGASVELGMPNVNDVDRLFSKWALDRYKLTNDKTQSLYCHIRDKIKQYYSRNPKDGKVKETNFEEVLYVILQLSAALGDNNYTLPMIAFSDLKELPRITSHQGEKDADGDDLRHLCFHLIDKLVNEFRKRCSTVKSLKPDEFKCFQSFINQLNSEFDVAFISLNYDNLITQACPKLFTGFDASGAFNPTSIYTRTNWGLLYHLHGSIHFDMKREISDMHTIKWNSELNSTFQQNSFGRNSWGTSEGVRFPTSVIVAGYGKNNQIQRVPFRTYYAELDKIVDTAETFLFLGYGFNDPHLNNCFHPIRKGSKKRPVVVIDFAGNKQDPLEFRNDSWSYNLFRALLYKKSDKLPPIVEDLVKNREFERAHPDNPLAIWHGGFLHACRYYSKFNTELSGGS